jgi:hypothetical protein
MAWVVLSLLTMNTGSEITLPRRALMALTTDPLNFTVQIYVNTLTVPLRQNKDELAR